MFYINSVIARTNDHLDDPGIQGYTSWDSFGPRPGYHRFGLDVGILLRASFGIVWAQVVSAAMKLIVGNLLLDGVWGKSWLRAHCLLC